MPKLVLAESVQMLLNSYDAQEELYLSALYTLYSILLDPYVDDEYKFSADYFPATQWRAAGLRSQKRRQQPGRD